MLKKSNREEKEELEQEISRREIETHFYPFQEEK